LLSGRRNGDDLGLPDLSKRIHLRAEAFRRRAQRIVREMRITIGC
jgi:hypothetical protein